MAEVTGKFLGENIVVLVGSTAIGSATAKSLSLTQAVAEVSDSDSSGFEEYLPSFRGGTIDFESYVDFADTEDVNSLASAMLTSTYADRTFTVVFGYNSVVGNTVYTASAILESLDYDAGDPKEAVTMSGTFRLTGTISSYAVS